MPSLEEFEQCAGVFAALRNYTRKHPHCTRSNVEKPLASKNWSACASQIIVIIIMSLIRTNAA